MAVSLDGKEKSLPGASPDDASVDSSDDGTEGRTLLNEDLDLTEPKQTSLATIRNTRVYALGAYIWAIAATLTAIVLAILLHNAGRPKYTPPLEAAPPSFSVQHTGKRNLIFMISDGMGPSSLSLARGYRQYEKKQRLRTSLTLDQYLVGQSRTRSLSSLITDSAAGATAFSCALNTYNGAVATKGTNKPCGTVLEAAKKAGYMTGLVVTTRITDATPAAFAAHVNRRSEEDRIAEQLIGDYPLGRVVDLMLGAGRCHFLPNKTTGSCRQDDTDLIKAAKKKGFSYIEDRKGFDDLKQGRSAKLPLLGLFADHSIPYEIDRRYETDMYPSLQEMTETALNALQEATKDSENGFFLMIEGSRIDHTGHANDPASQVHEVLAYDTAFRSALGFLDLSPTQGLIVATSDHETGGLSTARQPKPYKYPAYEWFPSVLANANHSTSWLHHEYQVELSKNGKDNLSSFLRSAIRKHLGIEDVTDDEINELIDHPEYASWIFAEIISARSGIGWSTHGHSGADVNVYTSNVHVAEKLMGGIDNFHVGKFLAEYLGVRHDPITDELREKTPKWDKKYPGGSGWMGKKSKKGDKVDGGSHLDRYKPGDTVDKRHDGCGCDSPH